MPDFSSHNLDATVPVARAKTLEPRALFARVSVAGMILVTAVVLGQNVSGWLVAPYLLLMGWLLLAPSHKGSPRPKLVEDNTTADASVVDDPQELAQSDLEISEARESLTPSVEQAAPPKTRKGKGRGKSKVQEPAERPPATWVRVGPGKFVRVEGGEPAPLGDAEPASSAPIEPSSTPGESVQIVSEPPPSTQDATDQSELEPANVQESCIAHVVLEQPPAEPAAIVCEPTVEEVSESSQIEALEPPADQAEPESEKDVHRDQPISWIRHLVLGRGSLHDRDNRTPGRARAHRPPSRRASGRVGAAPRVLHSRAPPAGRLARLRAIWRRVRGLTRGPSASSLR